MSSPSFFSTVFSPDAKLAIIIPGNNRKPGPLAKTGLTYKPNGAREIARRTRQVLAGSLKPDNGYWIVPKLAPVPPPVSGLDVAREQLYVHPDNASDRILTLGEAVTAKRNSKISKTMALTNILRETIQDRSVPTEQLKITTKNTAMAIVQTQRQPDPKKRIQHLMTLAEPFNISVGLEPDGTIFVTDDAGTEVLWRNVS